MKKHSKKSSFVERQRQKEREMELFGFRLLVKDFGSAVDRLYEAAIQTSGNP